MVTMIMALSVALLQGCSGQKNLINAIIITPSLSASTVNQGNSTTLIFTADQPLSRATTLTVNSSTLLHLRNTPLSCTIPTRGTICSVIITTDAAENPVAHHLTFTEKRGVTAVEFNPPALTLTVEGVLALSLTDPINGNNQGLSAEDITVTNKSPTENLTIQSINVENITTTESSHTPFEVYDGTNSAGNWCKTGCEDYCKIGDNLTSEQTCNIYIRATKDTGTGVGDSVSADLIVTATSDVNQASAEILVNNQPVLYVGGFFPTAGGITVNSIAKWDGSSWSALGSGVGSSVV